MPCLRPMRNPLHRHAHNHVLTISGPPRPPIFAALLMGGLGVVSWGWSDKSRGGVTLCKVLEFRVPQPEPSFTVGELGSIDLIVWIGYLLQSM